MIVKAVVDCLAYVAENGKHQSTRKNICATSWVRKLASGGFEEWLENMFQIMGACIHTEKSANTATGDSTSKGAGVEPILGVMVL